MLHVPASTSTSAWPWRLRAAGEDLSGGIRSWRIWYILALNDIRQRYRRSLLGQFWLTISMGITIGAIGIVYSVLLNQSPSSYLPFLGVGLVCWTLIAGIVADSCTAFIQSADFMRQCQLARSLFVWRMLLRNLIVFLHNLPIIVLVLLIFAVPVRWTAVLIAPALVLTMMTATWLGLLLGTLCARFRDLPQIIASLLQIAFLVTPVLYRPEPVSARLWAVTHLNPFASFTSLLRDPLLGQVPDTSHYLIAVLVAFGGMALTFPFFARFRARIVYWL